jgi:hypothetical protein
MIFSISVSVVGWPGRDEASNSNVGDRLNRIPIFKKNGFKDFTTAHKLPKSLFVKSLSH